MAFATVSDVVEYIKEEGIRFLDVRFTDVPGTEHHFTIPAEEFDENAAEQGLAFDGSSVRGFTSIDESDMTLLPDPATATLDPFRIEKTLNMKFNVFSMRKGSNVAVAGSGSSDIGSLPHRKDVEHEVLRA